MSPSDLGPPGTTVDAIAEEVWQHRLEREAPLRIRQGVPVTALQTGSLEEAEREAAFAGSVLDRLAAIDAAALSHEQHLTLEFLRSSLAESLLAPAQWWYQLPITPWQSYHLGLYRQQLFAPFLFEAEADAERFLELVEGYGRLLDQMLRKLGELDARGIRIPRPALPGVVTVLSGHRTSAETAFRIGPDRLAALSRASSARVGSDAERLLGQRILPAFDAILEAVSGDYQDRAPESVGLGQYPGGEEAYGQAVRLQTTLVLSPDQVHSTGIEQVAVLAGEMEAVRRSMGFTGSEAGFHQRLRTESRLFASTPAEVEARYLACMRRLEPRIPGWFKTLPGAPYGVERLDPGLEAGLTYGYYELPSAAQPTGRYRYNGSQLEQRSLISAATLVYHELAPGHHFHLARQLENESLPLVRRHAMIGAFNEGWAEYAAGLAREMGLLDDPFDLYGRLAHERFTAMRLVVDSGMNAFGWSLERGREYMRANTLESDVQVASETLRYSTDMPAQALAYRMGFLHITQLRRRAEQALGAAFDVRDFHEAVLGSGSLPLNLLESHVAWFIENARRELT